MSEHRSVYVAAVTKHALKIAETGCTRSSYPSGVVGWHGFQNAQQLKLGRFKLSPLEPKATSLALSSSGYSSRVSDAQLGSEAEQIKEASVD